MSFAILSHAANRKRCNSDSANSIKDLRLKYLWSDWPSRCKLATSEERKYDTGFVIPSCLPYQIQHAFGNYSRMRSCQPAWLSHQFCVFVHYLDFYAYQFLDQIADSDGYETHSFRWNWWFGMVNVLGEKILPDSGGYIIKHSSNSPQNLRPKES
jgi:hypothetical protein